MSKKNEFIIEQTITVGKKQYPYTLQPLGNGKTLVTCDAAGIKQEFLDEDILNLIIDLPDLIIAEKKYRKKFGQIIRFRCSTEEKREIERRALQEKFPTTTAYLKSLALGKK